jgi:hypothetical protein
MGDVSALSKESEREAVAANEHRTSLTEQCLPLNAHFLLTFGTMVAMRF